MPVWEGPVGQCQLTAASGPQRMLFSLCLVLPKCRLSKTPRAIFPSLALCFPLTLAFFFGVHWDRDLSLTTVSPVNMQHPLGNWEILND